MKDVILEKCKLPKDPEWLCALAFLVEIFHDFHILNTRLQGKDSSFALTFNEVNTFMIKLKLFCKNSEYHFSTIQQHYSDFIVVHFKYKTTIKSL